MTELFTLIAVATILVPAMAFAQSPLSSADAAMAHERFSDAENFEGRAVARIRVRNVGSEVSRNRGEATAAYRRSPLF